MVSKRKPDKHVPENWKSLIRYIFQHFRKLNVWNKIQFISAAIGIVGTMFGVLLYLLALIEHRIENAKTRPARVAIIRQVGEAYSALFYASEYLVNANSPSESQGQFENCQIHLGYARHGIEQLQSLTLRNGRTLDAITIAKISEVIDAASNLEKRLNYFSQIFSPAFTDYDFVSDPPFEKLAQLDKLISELRTDYPDVLEPGKSVAGNLKSLPELKTLWTSADVRWDRLWLKPESYIWHSDRGPCVFDRNNMARLPITTNTTRVYLMYGYE